MNPAKSKRGVVEKHTNTPPEQDRCWPGPIEGRNGGKDEAALVARGTLTSRPLPSETDK